jgi:23S rRNA (uracil1939-C5)-methyltransferase
VESDAASCEAARANLAARGHDGRVTEADAASWAIPNGTSVVVLDPPRTGARAVCERLVTSKVERVVYVSCDPQTLGRDLGILCGGPWEVRAVEVFEMFPHTSHVETVVALDRVRRGK